MKEGEFCLPGWGNLSPDERTQIMRLPVSHCVSAEEIRICREIKENWHSAELRITNILLEGDAGSGKTQLAKALSHNLGLPYCKITCFADMDKSDVIGSILPVMDDTELEKLSGLDAALLRAIYASDGTKSPLSIIGEQCGGKMGEAEVFTTWKRLKTLAEGRKENAVSYRFYPSEIVRAFQKGYLLEIQEPTVIRDAAVLMSLNSALEPDGSINLPTGVMQRHPNFIAVITTNRNYIGCRPLNEALRDRIQHAEKMDLPPVAVMAERAMIKTGCPDRQQALAFSEVIVLLDRAAKANGIHGVAGMRSLFYWLNAVRQGAGLRESMYHKVIYKMTTDPEEIKLLEEAVKKHPLLTSVKPEDAGRDRLSSPAAPPPGGQSQQSAGEEPKGGEDAETELPGNVGTKAGQAHSGHQKNPAEQVSGGKIPDGASLRQGSGSRPGNDEAGTSGNDFAHADVPGDNPDEEAAFSKRLNQMARSLSYGEDHRGIRICVRRPKWTEEDRTNYLAFSQPYRKIAGEAYRQTKEYLLFEESAAFSSGRLYGEKFDASALARQDFHHFAKRNPPDEKPSLAVALRIDESGSMSAENRMELARATAITLWEFCRACRIPVAVYGDTADASRLENVSLYAYADFEKPGAADGYRMMRMCPRQNNRDGMSIRFLAERLLATQAEKKLLFIVSDGNPRALEDYRGAKAENDIKGAISEYGRKGITMLAAAIGPDREAIQRMYGAERYLNITDLNTLGTQLVRIIKRHM